MPQDDLRKKAGDRKNMVKTVGKMIGGGVNEAATEMIQNIVKEKSALKTLAQTTLIGAKVGAKIKRPDTPLAPTPEPKKY
jgi:hypothetical protein